MTTTVLVADDQELVRSGFVMILEAQPDMRVVAQCADGISAVEAARRLRPDVVMVDISMPGLDGLEVTRILAGPGVQHPLNVVVVTIFGDDGHVDTALEYGARGFLLKDAGPALLVEAVRAAAAGQALISPSLTLKLLERRPRAAVASQTVTGDRAALSERELEIVRLAARGLTNREIGDELFLALGTVKSHLANIQNKLHLSNRVQVAAWAWEHRQVT